LLWAGAPVLPGAGGGGKKASWGGAPPVAQGHTPRGAVPQVCHRGDMFRRVAWGRGGGGGAKTFAGGGRGPGRGNPGGPEKRRLPVRLGGRKNSVSDGVFQRGRTNRLQKTPNLAKTPGSFSLSGHLADVFSGGQKGGQRNTPPELFGPQPEKNGGGRGGGTGGPVPWVQPGDFFGAVFVSLSKKGDSFLAISGQPSSKNGTQKKTRQPGIPHRPAVRTHRSFFPLFQGFRFQNRESQGRLLRPYRVPKGGRLFPGEKPTVRKKPDHGGDLRGESPRPARAGGGFEFSGGGKTLLIIGSAG